MTIPVKTKTLTLHQGTTQRVPLVRRYLPFAVEGDECSGYVNACTKEPVLDSDYTDEDYAGCTARMQMRPDIDSPTILLELTTENGGIELAGNTLTLVFQPVNTQGLNFEDAIAHVEIVRPNGDVERHYEIPCRLSREGTR